VPSCILNASTNRLLAICQLLSQAPHAHPEIHLSITADKGSISHKAWGPLASLTFTPIPASQTYLVTHFPEFPDEVETQEYQTALLLELTPQKPEIRGLANTAFGGGKQLLARLANELFQIRSDLRGYALNWLFDEFKIWGIDVLDQPVQFTSRKIHRGGLWRLWHRKIDTVSDPKAAFDFLIKGQPAEFAVMARESLLKDMGMNCAIVNPSSQKKLSDLPPDINPISVKFSKNGISLDFVAHKLLNGNTLLKVSVSNCEEGWLVWHALRDELERLGWFSIPNFEIIAPSIVKESEATASQEPPSSTLQSTPNQQINEANKESTQVWLTIPDKGWDRECVRLWHRGLTCKDIGIRLHKTDKTILNRLNQLRKDFGEQTVPYRNANYRPG